MHPDGAKYIYYKKKAEGIGLNKLACNYSQLLGVMIKRRCAPKRKGEKDDDDV